MTIINAHIYTMAGAGIFENGYIKITDGKIAAVGAMEAYRADEPEEIFDARGLLLFPGFIDAHTHIGMCEDGLGFEGDDLNEMTDPATPHLRGIDAVNPLDDCFHEALEAGVTAVVTGPGSANPISGQLLAMKTWGNYVDEMVIKAPVAMKFALGENPKTVYHDRKETPVTRMATAAVIRGQLQEAAQYKEKKEAGEDVDFDAACEALVPLLNKEIPAHIHAHRLDDMATAARIAKEFNLDYIIVHGTRGYLAPEILQKNNMRVLCGPIICERSKPELKGLTPKCPGILHEAGIPLAIITDHPVIPVQYLALCAGLAEREGLPHMEALKAITVNAAALAGIDGRVGSVEVGKDADFVLFSQNPLTLEAKPQAVIVDGVVRYQP
ncbi:MAG: amidohydrolase [Oscillospiraceae bacterium]|jgi:imidazolonepropionase-like amidohydrolase|nr:amidohydrolase [Oscillospiraceae bacterium]